MVSVLFFHSLLQLLYNLYLNLKYYIYIYNQYRYTDINYISYCICINMDYIVILYIILQFKNYTIIYYAYIFF